MKLTDQKINKICLIGSSELMLYCAEILNKFKIKTVIILSQRHAKSILPLQNKSPRYLFKKFSAQVKIVKDINNNKSINFLKKYNASLHLCFGPSWIFSEKLLNIKKNSFFNINCIPIPKYLGGAHYTWQILTSNRESGFFIQQINSNIDRGNIIYNKKKIISGKLISPMDYFIKNLNFQKKELKNFLINIFKNKSFKVQQFKKYNAKREYYPRLQTEINSFIDWSWYGQEIEIFCNSFSAPYNGARSFYEKKLFIFSKLKFYKKNNIHPYQFGIIFRKIQNTIFIFCNGGYLVYKVQKFENKNIKVKIKEGKRFYTPLLLLEKSYYNL